MTKLAKFRVSPQAIARTILARFEDQKPLTPQETEQVLSALENCGVPNAMTRLCTGFGKVILKELLH